MTPDNRPTIVHALHGFLGAPADFAPLAQRLGAGFLEVRPFESPPPRRNATRSLHIASWSLEGFFRHGAGPDCRAWPAAFASAFNTHFDAVAARHTLLGYSMGGRLALNLLARQARETTDAEDLPSWEAAIVVSAHPGLTHEGDRRRRAASDAEWARRFRDARWTDVVRDWNAQPVLATGAGVPPSRLGGDSDPGPERRRCLADMLTALSLARQEDLRDDLSRLATRSPGPPRVLLIAGARDDKYVRLVRDLQGRMVASECWVCESAGHRVPWDDPSGFADRVREFLGRGQVRTSAPGEAGGAAVRRGLAR